MRIVGYEITAMIDQGDAWVNAVDPKNHVFIAHTACAWNHDDLRTGSDTTDLRYITPEEAQAKNHTCGYCDEPLVEPQVFDFLWCLLVDRAWYQKRAKGARYTYGYLHTRYEYLEAGAYQPYEAIACPQCATKREVGGHELEDKRKLSLEILQAIFLHDGDTPHCEYCHKAIGQAAWIRYHWNRSSGQEVLREGNEHITTQEFRRQIEQAGLEVRKQHGLEVFDVRREGATLFSISYAELYHLTDINSLLDKHIRIVSK